MAGLSVHVAQCNGAAEHAGQSRYPAVELSHAAQVEYTVYKDAAGKYVDDSHPEATAVRCSPGPGCNGNMSVSISRHALYPADACQTGHCQCREGQRLVPSRVQHASMDCRADDGECMTLFT